jgi:hypothetical protein
MTHTAAQLAAIEAFVQALQTKFDAEGPGYGPGELHHTVFSVEYGPKYARIVETKYAGSRSVYCFVEIATGDILKSASWKAPAKGARGTILTPTFGVEFCDRFGGSLYKRR